MNPLHIPSQIDPGADPLYANLADAGADLRAMESVVIEPGQRALINTGIRIALQPEFVGYVMPRSGLALQKGVTVLNSPGVIDAGYRGKIHALLANFGDEPFVVEKGDRIAQLVISPVVHAKFIEDDLDYTDRMESGFGSSGVK